MRGDEEARVPLEIITIEVYRVGSDFTVRMDDRSADRLCWDEMLGQIATLTHPDIKSPRYQMRTADEDAAWRARMAKALTDAVSDQESVA